MKLLMATVSFRYHLHSIEEVFQYAKDCGFDGIELWEPHFLRHESDFIHILPWTPLAELPIRVMSGYLDVTGFSASNEAVLEQFRRKAESCRRLRVPLLRLFTGGLSSMQAASADWTAFFRRLEQMNEWAAVFGVEVAFETHPGTLLDSPSGVDRLVEVIEQEGWSGIGLNFDAFHVWEFGGSVLDYLDRWYRHIKHVHLKNARRRTGDFAMANVYHPMGRLGDSDSICRGVVDIPGVVQELEQRSYSGAMTLEWFGELSRSFFRSEVGALNGLLYAVKEHGHG